MAQLAQTAQTILNNGSKQSFQYPMTRQYRVCGEAMAPEYPSGANIVTREINPSIFVEWGETYMLETVDGPILVRLYPGKDDDHYLCKRNNIQKGYADIDIPKKAIYSIYRVIGMAVLK